MIFYYKNFKGSCCYNEVYGYHWGEVLNTPHVMLYEADNKMELEKAFVDVVDHFLERKPENKVTLNS